MVKRAISAGYEYVEPVRTPRRDTRQWGTDTAHCFIAGERRTPGRAVPPFVVKRTVGADDEYIEPVRTPSHRLGRAYADAAHALETGEFAFGA